MWKTSRIYEYELFVDVFKWIFDLFAQQLCGWKKVLCDNLRGDRNTVTFNFEGDNFWSLFSQQKNDNVWTFVFISKRIEEKRIHAQSDQQQIKIWFARNLKLSANAHQILWGHFGRELSTVTPY